MLAAAVLRLRAWKGCKRHCHLRVPPAAAKQRTAKYLLLRALSAVFGCLVVVAEPPPSLPRPQAANRASAPTSRPTRGFGCRQRAAVCGGASDRSAASALPGDLIVSQNTADEMVGRGAKFQSGKTALQRRDVTKIPKHDATKMGAMHGAGGAGDVLKVVTWNVERGQQLDVVAEEMVRLQADVFLLQELDMFCERSGDCNVVDELARRLDGDWFWAWTCEFVEFRHQVRDDADGEGQGGGAHGNAVLSRVPILDAWSFRHEHVPFDWGTYGVELGEPRVGGRVALGVVLDTLMLPGHPTMIAYSVHLENFCGVGSRCAQFREVLLDAHRAETEQHCTATIVAGDLNTLNSGVVALLPTYNDNGASYAFGLLQKSEAELWQEAVNSQPVGFSTSVSASGLDTAWPPCTLQDPFNPATHVTCEHGSWRAKLDWLLIDCRSLIVKRCSLGGTGSDHKWLAAQISSRP